MSSVHPFACVRQPWETVETEIPSPGACRPDPAGPPIPISSQRALAAEIRRAPVRGRGHTDTADARSVRYDKHRRGHATRPIDSPLPHELAESAKPRRALLLFLYEPFGAPAICRRPRLPLGLAPSRAPVLPSGDVAVLQSLSLSGPRNQGSL